MKEVKQVTDLIDELGSPENMSKTDWIDFCDQIADYCRTCAEATREEMDE